MLKSAFDDKSVVPEEHALNEVLGRSAGHWDNLKESLAADYPPLDETWGFAGRKYGWALRLRQKKRTVLYLTPHERYFTAGTAFGEKAVQAARESDLPSDVLESIETARKYAEGRPVWHDVRTKRDVEIVKKLCAIKMAN